MELTPEILERIPLHPVSCSWQPQSTETWHTKGLGHDSALSHHHQKELEGKDHYDWKPIFGRMLTLVDFAPEVEGPFACLDDICKEMNEWIRLDPLISDYWKNTKKERQTVSKFSATLMDFITSGLLVITGQAKPKMAYVAVGHDWLNYQSCVSGIAEAFGDT